MTTQTQIKPTTATAVRSNSRHEKGSLARVSQDARIVASVLWPSAEFYGWAREMKRVSDMLHGASLMASGDSDIWLSYLSETASEMMVCAQIAER